jgi:hypothetical protein
MITQYALRILKILSENMQKFIKTNNKVFLELDKSNFEKIMSFKKKKLGSGGQGDVLDAEFFVIKISHCIEMAENCYRLKNNIIYTTPQPTQLIVSMPDTVSENVIGYFLNKISSSSPNFVKNYGMIWRGDKSYSFVEKLKTDIFSKEVLKNGENLVIAILQYLHGLSVTQQTYKFTHNDSHLENILYKDEPKTQWNKVYLKVCKDSFSKKHTTRQFYVKNPGWNIKINDYGFSVLTDSKSRKSYVGIPNNLRNFNKFSHCVDYLTLFGCLFYLGFTSHGSESLTYKMRKMRKFIKNDKFLAQLAELNGFKNPCFLFFSIVCPSLFKKDMTEEKLTDNMNKIYNGKNYYRPYKNYIFLNPQLFETPEQAFINLANLRYPKGVNIVTRKTPKGVIKEYKDYRLIFNNKPFPAKLAIAKEIAISPHIIYRRLEYRNKKNDYNIGDSINSCDLKQIVHVSEIKAGASKNGFNFISECCGMTVSEMLEKRNKYGVVVNGVFFDILKTNYPLGYYKDKNFDGMYKQIPEEYRSFYAVIAWSNKAKSNLFIEPLSFLNEPEKLAKKYDFFGICGPLLIYDKWQFSEKDMFISDYNINIFQCVKPDHDTDHKILESGISIKKCENGKLVDRETRKPYLNCNQIRPGELSHGGNVNPRTAIAYNPVKKSIYFIVIEGRKLRGGGQDFIEMVKTIKKIDPGITRAVNLDGGMSSNMAFREVGKNYVNFVNPDKASPYLIGNVFGIVSN